MPSVTTGSKGLYPSSVPGSYSSHGPTQEQVVLGAKIQQRCPTSNLPFSVTTTSRAKIGGNSPQIVLHRGPATGVLSPVSTVCTNQGIPSPNTTSNPHLQAMSVLGNHYSELISIIRLAVDHVFLSSVPIPFMRRMCNFMYCIFEIVTIKLSRYDYAE